MFTDLDLTDPISMAGKSQFHCRAVCNSQKMPVRLFYSIFFSCYSLSLLFDSSYEIEKSFIMLYHQGNDPSTGRHKQENLSRKQKNY